MRCVILRRVSTVEQAQNGQGLEVQLQVCEEYASSNDLEVVAVYTDAGISGTKDIEDRAGMAQALRDIQNGLAEILVVAKLDRLARDLLIQESVLAAVRKAGGEVRSVAEPDVDSDDPTRKFIRQVLGAVAELERNMIRGRMMAGKAAKRAQGGFCGGSVPFGYRLSGGRVVEDRREQEILAFVRARGGQSLRSIGTQLVEAGYLPRSGAAAWNPNSIRQLARTAAQP